MKAKTLLVGAVVLVGVYLGAAFGSSFYIEKRYHEEVVETNIWLQENMPDVRVTELSYHRGLFDSQAQFAVEWDVRRSYLRQNEFYETPFELPQKPIRIIVDNDIRTGPWLGSKGLGLARVDTVANFDPAHVSPQIVQSLQGQNLITAQIKITYWKDFSTDVYGAAFDLDDGDTQFQYNGVAAQFQTRRFGTKADLSVNFPYLLLTQPSTQSQLLIHQLTYQARDSEVGDIVTWWNGNHNLALERFLIDGGKPEQQFDINKVLLVSEERRDGDFASYKMEIKFDAKVMGNSMQVNLYSRLDNINVPVMEEFSKQYEAAGNSPRAQQEAMRIMESRAADIFKASPAFIIDPFTITYNGQTAESHVDIRVASITADDLKRTPFMALLMTRLSVQMDFRAPASMLTREILGPKLYAQLQERIQQGALVNRGGTVTWDFSYQGGTAMMNGRSLGR